MKIDYVLIGSDKNPLYLDFWPLVSKAWKEKMNIEPVLGFISNEEYSFRNEYGIIKRFPLIKGVDSGLQSQIVRIFLSKFFEGNCMVSDIDMLPLSKKYFDYLAGFINDKNLVVASSDHQLSLINKMYPMCYIVGKSQAYRNIFDINLEWENFVKLIASRNEGWFSDQKYIYEKINDYNDIILLNRGWDMHGNANRRIDRTNWNYSEEGLRNEYYIDSHLLRPYSQYKNHISALI